MSVVVFDRAKALRELRLLNDIKQYRDENQIQKYYPDTGVLSREKYSMHVDFFHATAMEGCIMGANRSGKSVAGAFETTMHLTGQYPAWWAGRRFDGPTNCWTWAKNREKSFEVNQNKLLGPVGKWGTGFIPKRLILNITKDGNHARVLYVKHVPTGGTSVLTFKTYEQGREAAEGNEIDFMWADEEIPMDIYGECIIRLTSTVPGKQNGRIVLTYTPLKGLTEVSKLFAPNGKPATGYIPDTSRYVANITWDSVAHLTEDSKKEILKATPPYLRDARMRGIPVLGEGNVYPIDENTIKVKRFDIPDSWPRSFAMDCGWNNPALVWVAQDPSSKVYYLYDCWKQGQVLLMAIAQTIKDRGEWINGVSDPADPRTAEELRKYGIQLSKADNDVEAGISIVWQLLSLGQLKVFDSLESWFSEFRTYARNKDKIVKVDDHLMDATRYWALTGKTLMKIKPAPPPPVAPFRAVGGWQGG